MIWYKISRFDAKLNFRLVKARVFTRLVCTKQIRQEAET